MALLPTTLGRSFKLATANLWRNKFLTIATVLIMGLLLFIFNIVFSVNVLARDAIEELKTKVDLIVYVQDDADNLVVNQLIKELDAFPETTTVTYTSKEQALEGLLDKYSDDVNPFAEYDLENPLPASIQVLTEKPEDHETILAYLDQANYDDILLEVESNAENQKIVNNLIQITAFSEKLLLGTSIIFILGSVLIIVNAIHVTIWSRKKEIEIMRIVGANLNFIRSPFIIEGALYGIVAVLISTLLLILFVKTVDVSEIGLLTHVELNYTRLVLAQLLISAFIGMISSFVAINYYLNKKHQ